MPDDKQPGRLRDGDGGLGAAAIHRQHLAGGGSSAASERNSRGSPAASFSMGMRMATPVIAFGSLQRPGPACGGPGFLEISSR